MPRLDLVRDVVAALESSSIAVALGGSGLLAALGLTDRVRDWDLTTDSEPSAVLSALASSGLAYSEVSAGEGVYATRARFQVESEDHTVDLIVGFALRRGVEILNIPTRVTGTWNGLPLGDPSVWAEAYRLMGRQGPATALQAFLDRQRH